MLIAPLLPLNPFRILQPSHNKLIPFIYVPSEPVSKEIAPFLILVPNTLVEIILTFLNNCNVFPPKSSSVSKYKMPPSGKASIALHTLL